jgi:hypothetical protein
MKAIAAFLGLILLAGCGNPSKAESTPTAPDASPTRVSDFKRVTPLELIKAQADPLRGELEKVLSNACNTTGKDPDEISYWELARECCDRDTVLGQFCRKFVLPPNEVSPKDFDAMGKACIATVIGQRKSQNKPIFDLDRDAVADACLKALDLPARKKE